MLGVRLHSGTSRRSKFLPISLIIRSASLRGGFVASYILHVNRSITHARRGGQCRQESRERGYYHLRRQLQRPCPRVRPQRIKDCRHYQDCRSSRDCHCCPDCRSNQDSHFHPASHRCSAPSTLPRQSRSASRWSRSSPCRPPSPSGSR